MLFVPEVVARRSRFADLAFERALDEPPGELVEEAALGEQFL